MSAKYKFLRIYIILIFLFVYIPYAHAVFAAAAVFIGNFIITTAVAITIGYLASILLSEDPKNLATPAGIEDFNFPTTSEIRVRPIIFGSPRMSGYNDLWHGDLVTVAIKEKVKTNMFGNHKNVTVGYKYYFGLHYGWCTYAEELLELRMDEQILGSYNITSNTTIEIDEPNIFGGEKSQGGVSGNFSILFGGQSQPVNTYLDDTLGEGGTVLVPAFRGRVTTVAEGLYVGTTTSLKKMDAIWRRTTKTNRGADIWYKAKSEITDSNGLKGMNIANAIYEIFTDPDFSLGYANGVDETNFTEVADVLYDEGFGIHAVLDNPKNGLNLAKELVGYCNGFIRVDPKTNLFQIKLLRDDFDIDDLDILDKSLIEKVTKIQRDSSTEIFNQATIIFTNPDTRKPSATVAANTALISANGTVVNKDISAPYIHDPTVANKMATTSIQSLSVNSLKISFEGKRELGQYNRGDPVRVQMPDDGLTDVVFRVIDIDYGDLKRGKVKITATQDVFRAGEAIYANPDESLWKNTDEDPVDVVDRKLIEAPYFSIINSGAPYSPTQGSPLTSAVRTAGNSTVFDTWAKLSTESDYIESTQDAVFCPYCKLSAGISKGVSQLTVGYSDGIDLAEIETNERTWCIINNEALKVIDVDTSLTQITLERGCLDTLPESHSSGDDVFFMSEAFTLGGTLYHTGSLVDVKIVPSTTLGTISIDDVTKETVSINLRSVKPYNGSDFKGVANGQDIDFSWKHRNRLQTNSLVSQSDSSQTPEVGTTYTFEAYDNTVLVRSVTGITGESYTYTEANLIADFGSVANAKLSTSTYELFSVRSTIQSYQTWEITGDTI